MSINASISSSGNRRLLDHRDRAQLPEVVPQSEGRLRLDEELLAVASQMDIHAGETVHRMVLFLHTSVYVRNASFESHQNAIETSPYFSRHGKGCYVITPTGYNYIEWGIATPMPLSEIGLYDLYILSRNIGSMQITATVELRKISYRTLLTLDGHEVTGADAMRQLRRLGAWFRTPSSESIQGVLNWLLQSEGYSMRRYSDAR